jgi:hypothetical protein
MGIVKEIAELVAEGDNLVVWFSELNYYLTKYGVDTLEQLDNMLWFEYGVNLIVR